jgi:hypothetical protein
VKSFCGKTEACFEPGRVETVSLSCDANRYGDGVLVDLVLLSGIVVDDCECIWVGLVNCLRVSESIKSFADSVELVPLL